MAALDREVAEERAEAAEVEVGKLGEKISEMEVEIAVLREENCELLFTEIKLIRRSR